MHFLHDDAAGMSGALPYRHDDCLGLGQGANLPQPQTLWNMEPTIGPWRPARLAWQR